MNKTLSVPLLVFAGTIGAMAWSNIDDGISGYNYTQSMVLGRSDLDNRGSNSLSGVTNHGWNDYSIDLGKDAHYEITFEISVNTNGNTADPMFHIYLAGKNASILYGNYTNTYHNGTHYLDGYAGAFLSGTNVSGLDTVTGQAGSCVLNYDIQNRAGVSGSMKNASCVAAADGLPNTELVTGKHYYTIDIESFADTGQADLIKFKYSGANHSAGQWTSDLSITQVFSGITTNDQLSVGTFFAGNGGSVTLYGDATLYQSLVAQDRTEPPPVTPPAETPEVPPVDTSVPEPSAFGLLAGLGAIALAASRRRRSR